MTSLLSTPAYLAQRNLKDAGIPLNRGQILEGYAALFTYHNFQEMQPDLDTISFHLQNSAPWIVLQKELAALRLLSLGLDSGQTEIALQILIAQLQFPHVFQNEDDFLIDFYADGVFKDLLLGGNLAVVAKAQEKIKHHCSVFERDDANFGYLRNRKEMHWEGTISAQLHYRLENGQVARNGEYINIGSNVRFTKLGRGLLEPNPQIYVRASAIMPHDAMGGIPL